MAETLQPDLILLDLNLPTMHGFEVAEQIRRLAPHARLLFISQESSPDIVRQALSLGAHGYIQKLSAATDLLPGVDAVLAGRRFVSRSLRVFYQPADAPAPRRHEILFCSDDAAIIDGFTRFIAAALHAADAAIALVTESPTEHVSCRSCARRVWTLTAPSSVAPAFHLTLTSHLTPSDFWRRSAVCVRPPRKPGKHMPVSRFAENVRDACGLPAERRRRFNSNNSVANWRLTSTFCARIRCRTPTTITRSRASARSTPLCLPARRSGQEPLTSSLCAVPIGIRTSTFVPSPGRESTLTLPRMNRTRS